MYESGGAGVYGCGDGGLRIRGRGGWVGESRCIGARLFVHMCI